MSLGRGYLLDTNVISETRRLRADAQVTSFLQATPAVRLFISVLTLGELRKGIEMKRAGDPANAAALAVWVDQMEQTFAERILAVDTPVARQWGLFGANRSRPVIDTLIAATAAIHGLTLATRNVDDFAGIGVATFDPWTFATD